MLLITERFAQSHAKIPISIITTTDDPMRYIIVSRLHEVIVSIQFSPSRSSCVVNVINYLDLILNFPSKLILGMLFPNNILV